MEQEAGGWENARCKRHDGPRRREEEGGRQDTIRYACMIGVEVEGGTDQGIENRTRVEVGEAKSRTDEA